MANQSTSFILTILFLNAVATNGWAIRAKVGQGNFTVQSYNDPASLNQMSYVDTGIEIPSGKTWICVASPSNIATHDTTNTSFRINADNTCNASPGSSCAWRPKFISGAGASATIHNAASAQCVFGFGYYWNFSFTLNSAGRVIYNKSCGSAPDYNATGASVVCWYR